MAKVWYNRYTAQKNSVSRWLRTSHSFESDEQAMTFARRIRFTVLVNDITIDHYG